MTSLESKQRPCRKEGKEKVNLRANLERKIIMIWFLNSYGAEDVGKKKLTMTTGV